MRTIVLSASLIAFSVACGYAKLLLFPYLFFVELFTVAVFLSGVLAGPAWGLWLGGAVRPWFLFAPERSGAFRRRIPALVACGAIATGPLPVAQHLASNLAIFGVVGHLAIPWLRRHPVTTRHAA